MWSNEAAFPMCLKENELPMLKCKSWMGILKHHVVHVKSTESKVENTFILTVGSLSFLGVCMTAGSNVGLFQFHY